MRLARENAPLLERAAELAAVDAALAAIEAGSGAVVAIEGPAGIGKTTLLGETRARATEAGLAALTSRASEIERNFPYGVVRQLFESGVLGRDEHARGDIFRGAAAQAERLFDPARVGEADTGEDATFALLHGLYWLTLNLAETSPLLLTVDDLQWSDAASLRFVAYLGRRLEGTRCGIVATVRPIADEDPVLAELLADPATTRVRPAALSADAVAEVIRTTLSSEADDAFCLAAYRATGGNPLLLHELLRTIAAEGIAPTAASVGAVERLAPDAVARSVRVRLARLPAEAAALARSVAILGDGCAGAHAAALGGLEPRELAPSAAALACQSLLEPEPPLRFVHPLVRNAVYESTPPHERAQEHARAAQVLRTAGGDDDVVAAQLLLAPAGIVSDAAAFLCTTAARAAAEGAPESAAAYLTRALEEPMPDPERAAMLLDLAQVELNLGAPTIVERLRSAVSLLSAVEDRVRAQLELGRALYWRGEEEQAVEVLEQALAEPIDDGDLRRRVQAELFTNASRLATHYREARGQLRALDLAGDEGPAARLLLGLQAYHAAAGGGDRGRALKRAVRALTTMSEDDRAWNYLPSTYALLAGDELEQAVGFLDPLIIAARRRGAVFNFGGLAIMRAIVHYARGALVEAEADARMALDAIPHRKVWFVPHVHAWLAQILIERGLLDEAAELARLAEAAVGDALDPFSRAPVLRATAMVAAARGDHRTAVNAARALGENLDAYGHHNPAFSYPSWRSLAAYSHHALGEGAVAVELAREELRLAREWGAPRSVGRALRTLGLVDGGERGIDLVHEAVDTLVDSPARLEHAYALVDLGAALRRGNQRVEAREFLREGLELAQQCGGQLLRERAHEELVATGARPRRLVRSGVDALTPSERRIAAMAAQGMANRDIAQALFVTLRTVEMHLSNAFRKLDISARTQLPEALAARASRESGIER